MGLEKESTMSPFKSLFPSKWAAALVIVAIMLASATVASAYPPDSGDHSGCISTSNGHFHQHDLWWTDFDLEYPGGDNSQLKWPGNRSIDINGYWGGGWWTIHGDAAHENTGWMHCH